MTQQRFKTKQELAQDSLDQAPMSLIPKIDLVPHTLFLLCGPTHSGKSTFAEDLGQLSVYNGLTFISISSDDLRRKLLQTSTVSPYGGFGEESRYSAGMGAVSGPAFDLLMTQLRAQVSYPISTEIIVVDTTGMNEKFRDQVKEIGDKTGYRVVLVTFEFKHRSDYIPNTGVSKNAERIIDLSVAKFRQKVLPTLTSRQFQNRIRLKHRDSFGWDIPRDAEWWNDFVVDIWTENATSDYAKAKIQLVQLTDVEVSVVVTSSKSGWLEAAADKAEQERAGSPIFAIIGDSHECVKELKELIAKVSETYPLARIVHVGDYLDKGEDTAAMINFMYERMGLGDIIIQGNHEAYVVRKLRGEIKNSGMTEEKELGYFTSLKVLDPKNPETPTEERIAELKRKLFAIYDSSLPFAILGNYSESGSLPVFVTHAPCSNKYLGKVHDEALREQRNYRIVDRQKPIMEELDWLYKEADYSHPLHVFGHVSHFAKDLKGLRFKNKVFLDTGAVYGGRLTALIVQEGGIVGRVDVTCEKRCEAEVPTDLGLGPKQERVFNLSDYELDKRDYRLIKEVEEKGVKYISGTMSPAPASETELEPLQGAYDWYKKLGVQSIVLQPKYMGSRCQMYLSSEKSETFAVSRSGWVIKGVTGKTNEEYQAFLESVWEQHEHLRGQETLILDGELLPWSALGAGLIEKNFDPYRKLVRTELETLALDEGFAGLTEFAAGFNLTQKVEDIVSFEIALARYSQPGDPQFSAFDVLNPSWDTASAEYKWDKVNGEKTQVVVLGVPESEAEGAKFFEELTVGRGMEGVVVKPFKSEWSDLPYMKVRSPEYLRLVYGYDYLNPARYNRLVRQKNISGKVRLSITEHRNAKAMLTAQGDAKTELVVKMIGSMKQEKELDPRL